MSVANSSKDDEGCFSLAAIVLLALACVFFVNRILRRRWGWAYSWKWRPEISLCSGLHGVRRIFSGFCNSQPESDPLKMDKNAKKMSGDAVDNRVVGRSRMFDSNCEVPALNESDLKELISFINEIDGGPPWQLMMQKSTPTLVYQAWYRDPQIGPTQYRTRTIFKNVSPEVVRDFFWDDEFRAKWDKMLIEYRTLQVCSENGTMIVQWIRKLPVIWSEREYIIVRRIWESRSCYYCVTKGTEYSSLPKRRTARRVELYYSSYCISSVLLDNDQEHTEVLFFHYEDFSLPKEIVRVAARAGMWGLMKRMDVAVQSYNIARANGAPPSDYARLAAVTTEFGPSTVSVDHLRIDTAERWTHAVKNQKKVGNVPKWLMVVGLVIVSGLTAQVARKRMPSREGGGCLWRCPPNRIRRADSNKR